MHIHSEWKPKLLLLLLRYFGNFKVGLQRKNLKQIVEFSFGEVCRQLWYNWIHSNKKIIWKNLFLRSATNASLEIRKMDWIHYHGLKNLPTFYFFLVVCKVSTLLYWNFDPNFTKLITFKICKDPDKKSEHGIFETFKQNI